MSDSDVMAAERAIEAPVSAHSFFNRRFLKKDLRGIFPAGFNAYNVAVADQRAAGTGGPGTLSVKGVSPPKSGAKADTSTGPGNDGDGGGGGAKNNRGIAPTRESFMAWARGELPMNDDMSATNSVLEPIPEQDALDPFRDVAGPYFHVAKPQQSSAPKPRPGTGLTDNSDNLTDTMHTIQSKLSIHTMMALAPPNAYNKELTMAEVPLYQRDPRAPYKPKQPAPGTGRERVFNAPSVMPVLIPTLNLHSAGYERLSHGPASSSSSSGGLAGPNPHGSTASSHGELHGSMSYDNWIDEQKQLKGKSTLVFSPASTTVQPSLQNGDETHSVGALSNIDKAVVIKMNLGGSASAPSAPGAIITRPSSNTSKVKAVPLREQRDKFSTIPPPAAGLDGPTGLFLDSQHSVASDLLASYDPYNLNATRTLHLEIHHFKDMLLSTSVRQAISRPCRVETIVLRFSLQELATLLQTIIHVDPERLATGAGTGTSTDSDAAAATLTGATGAIASASAPPYSRSKKSKDPMIFYFRPAYNDWRPVRHALDWDQAKSIVTPPMHGHGQAQGQHHYKLAGLKIMFTMNIEADLDYVQQLALAGTDPSLLHGARNNSMAQTQTGSTLSPLQTLESAADGGGPAVRDTEDTAISETGIGLQKPTDVSRVSAMNTDETTASMILKIMGTQGAPDGGNGFASPTPPSHKLFPSGSGVDERKGGSRVITSTTTAVIASIATGGSARRLGTSSDAPLRSYTSGSTNTIELPALPSVPHRGAKLPVPAGAAAKAAAARPGPEARQQKHLLNIIPMGQPSLAKQVEMAKHLEQNLLKTRF